MKKYVLFFVAVLSLFQAQAAFPLATTYRGVQVLQPAPMGQVGANCGYHAVYNGAAALQHVRGGRAFAHRSFTFDRADRDALFSPAGAWGALAATQTDPAYAGADNLESEVIRLLIETFIPEIGHNFVVLDNAQQFLGNKFGKFNTPDGRERFWAAVRGLITAQTPCEFLFVVNTAQAAQGAIGGGHWIMVLFHKDATGVHHYYVADTGGSYVDSPLVTGIIDHIENPAGYVATVGEIRWAFGGEEEAQITYNEQLRREREEEERRLAEWEAQAFTASAAMAQRPARAGNDDEDDEMALARALSLSAVQQEVPAGAEEVAPVQAQDAHMCTICYDPSPIPLNQVAPFPCGHIFHQDCFGQLMARTATGNPACPLCRCLYREEPTANEGAWGYQGDPLARALRESEHEGAAHMRRLEEQRQREDVEFARALAESVRIEQDLQRETQRREEEFFAESRRLVAAQKQRNLKEQRRLQNEEERLLAQALAQSLQDQEGPAHLAALYRPPVAPRPTVAPRLGAAAAHQPAALQPGVRPPVAPRPGAQPQLGAARPAAAAQMTAIERIIAEQRKAFEELERAKQRK